MKARILFQDQKYDEAENVLKALIEKNPDCVKAYRLLGELYYANLRLDDGVKFIRRALNRTWPDPKKDKSVLYTELGNLVERQGKENEARKYFQKALELNPENVEARKFIEISLLMGMHITPENLFGGVDDEADKAIFLDDYPDMVSLRARPKKSMKSKEDSPYSLIVQAHFYLIEGRYSQARRTLEEALDKFPLDVTAYTLKGRLAFETNDYRVAQVAYSRAKVLHRNNYDTLLGEACVDLVRRDFESAEKILSSLNTLPHCKREQYRRLGDVYSKHLRDPGTARKYYKVALESSDQEESLLLTLSGLCEIELKEGNDQQAKKYFRRALAEFPGSNVPYSKIIDVMIRNKKFDMTKKYIAEFEKARSKYGWKPVSVSSAYLRFAHSYLITGKLDEAMQMLKNAKKVYPGTVDPGFPDSGEILLARQKDRKFAKTFYEKSVEMYPEDPISLIYLGFLLEEKGDRQKAESYYRKAKQFTLSPGFLNYQKAWIYSIRGRNKEAVRELRKACKKDIFNACRACADMVFDRFRDDKFFKQELPELIKQVKDKTPAPSPDEFEL
ncbi:MAG: tetratricopeptide repeat protein [Candidatus Eremiobacteraeota bacterium]|nr:tetratricopeptide repeat protein [Candidatus Eremiobacteraeota bacterium]